MLAPHGCVTNPMQAAMALQLIVQPAMAASPTPSPQPLMSWPPASSTFVVHSMSSDVPFTFMFALVVYVTPVGLDDALGLEDALGLDDALGLEDGLALGEALGLDDALGLEDGLALGEALGLDDVLGLEDGLALGEALGLDDALGLDPTWQAQHSSKAEPRSVS